MRGELLDAAGIPGQNPKPKTKTKPTKRGKIESEQQELQPQQQQQSQSPPKDHNPTKVVYAANDILVIDPTISRSAELS